MNAIKTRLALHIALVVATSVAFGGVKYWDNPAFRAYDAGDYVTNGLVLHYDGIRNAGADAEHSPTTDTWANLASGGAYPLGWYSWIKRDGADSYDRRNGNTAHGAWTANGFAFDGLEGFAATNISFGIGPEYTHQFVMTASTSDLDNENGTTGYIFRPGKAWSCNAVAIRQTANGTTTPANAVYAIDETRFGNNSTRPNFSNANPRYATVLADAAALRVFEGTEIPTDSTGGNSYKAGSRSATDNNSWFAFGSQYDGSPRSPRNNLQSFNGTLHAVRYYSRALSYEELAWNRVVDEYRFFGAAAPIPVTNVVVATSAEGVEGDQPCGAYALDAEGFTFTAPAQRTVDGRRYVLSGYTLSTWNGSGWGAPVAHESGSYAATSSATVLLTWQYSRPAGEGQLATYDVNDYVQSGLLLHYDGILNAGADAAHDPEARQWKNIAPGYESRWPMDWCSYIAGSGGSYGWSRNNYTEGAWAGNGFAFTGKGYFAKWNDGDPFAVPTNFTLQISVTGDIADQLGDPAYLWTANPGWSYGSVAMRKSNNSAANGNANSVYYVNSKVHPAARPNFYPPAAKPSYVTTIVDYDDARRSYIFEGTSRPAGGGYDAPAITGSSPATNLTWFSVGGFHGRSGDAANLQCFKGTLHNVRLYNRALTDAEVAQNRKVDEYRLFGRYAEPNVTVQSTYSYLEGYDKCGGYEVVGSYTFVAPESVTAPNGITYVCDGYILERRSGAEWTDPVSYESSSYAYDASAGTVRLTWKWRATHGLRTAADYGFDDYSPAGLRLHYDGLLNAGVGVARSTTATKWVNVGSGGSSYDLSLTKGADDSAWASDGYAFGGQSKFMTSVSNVWNRTYTEQTVLDAPYADNTADSDGNYVYSSAFNKMAMVVCGRTAAKTVWFHTQGLTHNEMPHATNADAERFTYVTTMLDDAGRTATVFTGTEPPTGGTLADGYLKRSSMADAHVGKLALGGWGGQTDNYLVGTVKDFRYYDRILTPEELVRNRNVDAVRYFGALGVTNVVVEVEAGSGIEATPSAGEYLVEGSYEFTATRNGGTSALGYRVQEWDEAGQRWVHPRTVESPTFVYDADSAAKVKITWREIQPFFFIVR